RPKPIKDEHQGSSPQKTEEDTYHLPHPPTLLSHQACGVLSHHHASVLNSLQLINASSHWAYSSYSMLASLPNCQRRQQSAVDWSCEPTCRKLFAGAAVRE